MYIFVESPLFSRLVNDYLSDVEYSHLQWFLMKDPGVGDIIRGSGGVRKLRWSAKGKGKRGGLRIIYYWHEKLHEIWLLTLYAKNEAEDIPVGLLKKIREQFE